MLRFVVGSFLDFFVCVFENEVFVVGVYLLSTVKTVIVTE